MKLKPAFPAIIGLLLIAAGLFIYLNAPPPRNSGNKPSREDRPQLREDKPPLSQGSGRNFAVREGESLKRVALRLKRQNLITSARFLEALHLATGRMGIKKGIYRISRDDTSLGILYKLVSGDVLTHRITIPEGFNVYQVAERLEAAGVTAPGEFLYHAFNGRYLETLGIRAPSAEGYLFPDTYVFPEGSDPRDILPVMIKRLRSVLSSMDLARSKDHGLSAHEILTLASLIEKEAKIPSERRVISSVFHNRLKRGMKLDCDPTVRYAVKKFSGRLSVQDLAFRSPFNTYVTIGLPPTPICMPGRDSIDAALNPDETEFLFFVARNDGSHYFSEKLRDHNRAVDFFQKGVKNGFIDRQKL